MTTFLLYKMCLENEKKSVKRRFTTFFQKTTVLLLPNWIYSYGSGMSDLVPILCLAEEQ